MRLTFDFSSWKRAFKVRPTRLYSPIGSCQQGGEFTLSLAHELSGLGSTRVVRFSVSARRRIDEPDWMATGSQDEKIQGRIEPMGEEGTVGNGGRRAAGDIGAA